EVPRRQAWAPPLDRLITLHAREVSLRDALGRLSAAAALRLTYATESLPLDQRVCVSLESVAAGDALAYLLRDVNVEAVVAGPEQVVLAPLAAPPLASADAPDPDRVIQLERIVVTGSAGGASE